MTAPSPADVARPGVVVRLRVGSIVYTSSKMTLEAAMARYRELRREVAENGRFPQLLDFDAGPDFYAPVAIRTDRITAIEVRNVHADHLRPAFADRVSS